MVAMTKEQARRAWQTGAFSLEQIHQSAETIRSEWTTTERQRRSELARISQQGLFGQTLTPLMKKNAHLS